MDITLKNIDELRERANVSYKEAKEALEKNDGNMIDAIIFLESEDKTVYDRAKKATYREEERKRVSEKKEKYKSNADDFTDSFKKIIKNLNNTRIIMYNSERVVFDISLTLTILVSVFAFPVVVAVFVLGLIFNNKFKVISKDKKTDVVNSVLNKAAKVSQDVANNLKEKVKNSDNTETEENEEE